MEIVRYLALLLSVLLIHGCGNSDRISTTPAPEGTSMRAALLTTDTRVVSVLVEVFSEGVLVDSQVINVAPLPLPEATVMGGDAFFTVRPGKYSVDAVARDDSGENIAECARASTTAEVFAEIGRASCRERV